MNMCGPLPSPACAPDPVPPTATSYVPVPRAAARGFH